MRIKKHIPPLRIEIKPSKILWGQVGLFAACPLRKGALVAAAKDFAEVFVPQAKVRKMDRVTQDRIIAHCGATRGGYLLPRHCDLNRLSIQWYMNHSCDPNVGFDQKDNFVALRKIVAGEELVFDYGTLHENPKWRLACKCGTSKCRGVVTGSDWKLPELQRRYQGHFVSYLRAKIRKAIQGENKTAKAS